MRLQNSTILLILFLCFWGTLFGQSDRYRVYPCQTEADVVNIVDTVLLKGLKEKGLVSNIRFVKGLPQMVGRFTGGGAFAFDRGIVMSTGYVENTVGPNSVPDMGSDCGQPGDDDLKDLAGWFARSKDAVVIEFDFQPISNRMEFTYVWASEEYSLYVNEGFNDVFGFFVNGAGLNGSFSNNSENIARIPGTNEYVGVKTINCGQSYDYTQPPMGPGKNCHLLRWNNHFSGRPNALKYPEFNGYTVPLEARSNLVPCEKYHIKLAVSDISDGYIDSGVYLKAESFNIGDITAEVIPQKPSIGKKLIKDCNEVTVKFELSDPLTFDLNIPLEYESEVDEQNYSELPASVKIPSGQNVVSFPIRAMSNDIGMKEGDIRMRYSENVCNWTNPKTEDIKIVSKYPLKCDLLNGLGPVNCEDDITLTSSVDGGYGDISYAWNYGDSTGSGQDFTIHATSDSYVSLHVSDVCGAVADDQKLIEILPIDLNLGPDLDICLNADITLDATTEHVTYDWSNGANSSTNVYNVKGDSLVWCKIDNVCGMSAADSVRIHAILPTAYAGEDTLICPGKSVELTANLGESYNWNTGDDSQSITVSPENNTEYIVQVEDVCGNVASDTVFVNLFKDDFAFAGNDTLVCPDSSVPLYAKGGDEVEWYCGDKMISDKRHWDCMVKENMELVLMTRGYCEVYDTLHIDVEKKADFSFSTASMTACDSLPIVVDNLMPVSDDYTWDWFLNGKMITHGNNIDTCIYQPGKYNINVVCTSKLGCHSSYDFTENYTLNPTPVPQIFNDDQLLSSFDTVVVCPNMNLLLEGKGGASMNWYMGDELLGNEHSLIVLSPEDAYYRLKVKDLCSAVDSVYVRQEVLPDIDLSYLKDSVCGEGAISVGNNTAEKDIYQWTWWMNGEEVSSSNDFYEDHLPPGEYNLDVNLQSKYKCVKSKSLGGVLKVFPNPEVSILYSEDEVNAGDQSYVYNADVNDEDVKYWWYLGDELVADTNFVSLHFPDIQDYYLRLEIEDKNLCRADASLGIKAAARNEQLLVPNAFSPNGDGVNDYFAILHGAFEEFDCMIFDRWGGLIYKTTDPDFEWDGRKFGKGPILSGEFALSIRYKFPGGEKKQYKSLIYLLK